MNLQEIIGDSYKEDMTIEEINKALVDKNLVNKSVFDKTASELAKAKKDLKDKMTADEQREEEYKTLKRNSEISNLEKEYIKLGYNSELALATATAQYDGDTATVFKNQAKFAEDFKKSIDAEYLKKTPNPPAGQAEAGSKATKPIDYDEAIEEAQSRGDTSMAVSLINQKTEAMKEASKE